MLFFVFVVAPAAAASAASANYWLVTDSFTR